MRPGRLIVASLALVAGCASSPSADRVVRVATFNASMYGRESGDLAARLHGGDDEQARAIAAVVQRVRPDVLLINEFDFDEAAISAFQFDYLATPQFGGEPISFEYSTFGPVNTGEPSGHDLDGDGRTDGPGDAFGYGRYPGQYGLVVFSRFPFGDAGRSFRHFLWRDMPGARIPVGFYSDAALDVLRLSSKTHRDVVVEWPGGGDVHLLVSHPTPPVFDGPEDRNGRRNHDEIRLWIDYVSMGADGYLVDDVGVRGGIAGAPFLVLGDLNADPHDGDSREAIASLLSHPRVNAAVVPRSRGGALAARRQGGVNADHCGDPAADTGDFDDHTVGNLRVDYVLPSTEFEVRDTGVFWPPAGAPGAELLVHSDHRLVWLDVVLR